MTLGARFFNLLLWDGLSPGHAHQDCAWHNSCIEMEIENEVSQMHGEHLLPSSWSWSPSREGFIMFQALLGLRDTFKHTNTRRSSQDMIAGIQRDCAFLCFANMPLVLSQLQRSAVECRFLHCLPMAYKRPKFAKTGTCQMPSCTGSNFSVLGAHAFRRQMVLSPKSFGWCCLHYCSGQGVKSWGKVFNVARNSDIDRLQLQDLFQCH